jgi:hypothetical protein
MTPTFIPAEAVKMPGYMLFASPSLYQGQEVVAAIAGLPENSAPVEARLVIRSYNADDQLDLLAGPAETVKPGERATLRWRIPDLNGLPVEAIGFEVTGEGAIAIDTLTWDGVPTVTFARPEGATGELWRRAWIDGVDHFEARWFEAFRLSKNDGRGIISQGTRDWDDYRAEATITPYLAKQIGLAARVQGLRRYYALLLGADNIARLVKMDDTETVLAETPFPREVFVPYTLAIEVEGDRITGSVNGSTLLAASDPGSRLTAGGVGLVIEEGTLGCEAVSVSPIGK